MPSCRLLGVPAAALLAGCSILYNPDNLPEPIDAPGPDAPPDAPIDVNPDLFDITAIEPTTIDEGVGSDGGRHAMFVLRGTAILEGQASVTVAFVADTSGDGGLPVTMPPAPADIDFAVGAGNTRAAVTMPIPVIPELLDGRTLTMRITVSQGGVDKSQDVTIRGLDELTLDAPADHTRALYSRITVAGNVHFDGADPIRLHATAGIAFGATVDGDAVGGAPGPHGCAGGPNTVPGGCAPGGGGPGTNAVVLGLNNGSAGGGGGFGEVGTIGAGTSAGAPGEDSGDDMLVPIETGPGSAGNRGNGGGGGGNGLLNAAGGDGGGGGGVIYVRAGGDITVDAMGALRARGGNGTFANGSGGGGGSGGALLVRSGGAIVSSTRWMSAGAGTGGTGNGNAGGAGGVGRIRVDAADGDVGSAMSNNPTPVRGPAWSRSVPLITGTSPFTAQLRGDADRAFNLRLNGDPMGSAMPGVGDTVNVPDITLEPGRNVLCAVAKAGELGEESLSCIDVFYTGS